MVQTQVAQTNACVLHLVISYESIPFWSEVFLILDHAVIDGLSDVHNHVVVLVVDVVLFLRSSKQ